MGNNFNYPWSGIGLIDQMIESIRWQGRYYENGTSVPQQAANGLFQSPVCRSYSSFLQELFEYFSRILTSFQGEYGVTYKSQGMIMRTSLALGAQWRDMTRITSNISQAYGPFNGQVSPQQMVCDCSVREDIEDFALNASLGHLNDLTLW